MYCKNCGNQLPEGSNVCPQCGVPVGVGKNFCPNCNNPTDELAVVCVKCGYPLKENASAYVNNGVNMAPNGMAVEPKSKIVGGLLGIFLGVFGVHNFYLGYRDKAIAQLLLGTVGTLLCGLGPIASGIWGFIEGIMILCGNIKTDANGMPLKD